VRAARGILLSISGGSDLSLHEVNEAAEIVRAASDDRTNIIFGASVDEQLAGQMWVTVVATGFSMTGGPAGSGTHTSRPVVPPPDDLLEPPSFLQS
jgi:cell division protein FtsZ